MGPSPPSRHPSQEQDYAARNEVFEGNICRLATSALDFFALEEANGADEYKSYTYMESSTPSSRSGTNGKASVITEEVHVGVLVSKALDM